MFDIMNEARADPATSPLAARLAAIRAHYPTSEPEMVAEVVRSVLASMRGDLMSKEVSLLAEVEELGNLMPHVGPGSLRGRLLAAGWKERTGVRPTFLEVTGLQAPPEK